MVGRGGVMYELFDHSLSVWNKNAYTFEKDKQKMLLSSYKFFLS